MHFSFWIVVAVCYLDSLLRDSPMFSPENVMGQIGLSMR